SRGGTPGSGSSSAAIIAALAAGSGSAQGSGAGSSSGSAGSGGGSAVIAPPAKLEPSASNKLDKPTAQRLVAARKLLDRYACRAARTTLQGLLAKRPNVAFAHYLMGSAQICSGQHRQGLESYARALKLEAALASDKRVARDVTGLLALRSRDTRLAALSFIEKHLGKVGHPVIIKAATNRQRAVRHAAAASATRLGIDKQIDWVRSLELDLRQLSCRQIKRRHVIDRLARHGDDPRVRKILEHAKRARAGFFRHRYRYGCVRERIKQALHALPQGK
ncbi:MAG: hypothetical protein KC503_45290, partial [Myxococcales bacterium]|nr:hypothetical protein [Myxococcales bacterium]